MGEWHILPWTYQYIGAAIISLIVSIYILIKSRESIVAKYFFVFGMLVTLWQVSTFLHRNAPNAYLSGIFFGLVHIFSFTAMTFLFLAMLHLFKENISWEKWLVLVSVIVGATALIGDAYDFVWVENLGWTYIAEKPWKYLYMSYLIFFVIAMFAAFSYIVKKYPALRSKVTLIFLGYICSSIIGIAISNIYLASHPHSPPIGGFLITASLIMIGVGIMLRPTKIRVESTDKISKLISDIIQEIYESIPGSALGDKYIEFQKIMVKGLGLENIAQISENHTIRINFKGGIDDLKEIVDSMTYGLEAISHLLSRNINLDPYVNLINSVYNNIVKDAGSSEAKRWLNSFIKKHITFLYRTGTIYQIKEFEDDFLETYRNGKLYIIASENPLTEKERFVKFKDLGIKTMYVTKYMQHISEKPFYDYSDKHVYIKSVDPNAEDLSNENYLWKNIFEKALQENCGVIIMDCLDILILTMGEAKFNGFIERVKNFCKSNGMTFIGIINKKTVTYSPPKNMLEGGDILLI